MDSMEKLQKFPNRDSPRNHHKKSDVELLELRHSTAMSWYLVNSRRLDLLSLQVSLVKAVCRQPSMIASNSLISQNRHFDIAASDTVVAHSSIHGIQREIGPFSSRIY